jgi:hypothetical protein
MLMHLDPEHCAIEDMSDIAKVYRRTSRPAWIDVVRKHLALDLELL